MRARVTPRYKSRRSPTRNPLQTRAYPAVFKSVLPNNVRKTLFIFYRGPTLEQKSGMRNKKFVQIVVWVTVIAMVLSLAVAAISLF